MRRTLSGACGLAALALLSRPAAAETVPKLDIETTCKSAAKASVSDNANEAGCLRSEREARTEAERRWGDYKPAAKRQCEDQFKAGGYPSYVEMVTCLELASGTVPSQQDSAGPATAGPGAPQGKAPPREGGASNLTQEPSPRQRTNPIDVLDKK